MVVALAIALLALAAPGLPLGLVLLPRVLPALVPAGARTQRLEQKRREPYEESGLVRWWQQLPLLQGAVAAVEA